MTLLLEQVVGARGVSRSADALIVYTHATENQVWRLANETLMPAYCSGSTQSTYAHNKAMNEEVSEAGVISQTMFDPDIGAMMGYCHHGGIGYGMNTIGPDMHPDEADQYQMTRRTLGLLNNQFVSYGWCDPAQRLQWEAAYMLDANRIPLFLSIPPGDFLGMACLTHIVTPGGRGVINPATRDFIDLIERSLIPPGS